MTARLLIGDVFDCMAELPDGSFDVIITSPPFLALRSYLPDGHPDKAKEIGSEATPAAFLDVMLALTAEWGRLLAPHGSIAIEIGDTYSGSGGAGGDYSDGGLRDGQARFDGSAAKARRLAGDYPDRDAYPRPPRNRTRNPDGWPLAKSLAMIPELYAASLAYGRNLLRAPMTAREIVDYAEGWTFDHPDASAIDLLRMLRYWLGRHAEPGPTREYERWRVRNFKPWIRSNPPVGALGDKERPATSYITVACRATDRYFDLDAVRTASVWEDHRNTYAARYEDTGKSKHGSRADGGKFTSSGANPAGAPPLDWWHHVDAILDAELDARAGKCNGGEVKPGSVLPGGRLGSGDGTQNNGLGRATQGALTVGARGVHLRRALERAGILTTHDALDVSPKGYAGAHYAVWPPELVKLLLLEMAPRRVCTTCGTPSRRIVGETTYTAANGQRVDRNEWKSGITDGMAAHSHKPDGGVTAHRPIVGWSDCGCPDHGWRPAHILDPFAGSGTTLAVATGLGHTATGIDLDERNADLCAERVGMFLEVIHQPTEAIA